MGKDQTAWRPGVTGNAAAGGNAGTGNAGTGNAGTGNAAVAGTAAEGYVLAGAVAVVLAALITLSGPPLTPAAYLFAAGFGAILLLRRRLTGTVVVLSVLGTFAYYTLDLPTIGVALPVVAAVFSAAEFGRTTIAVTAGIVVFAVSLGFRLRDDPQPLATLLGTDAAANLGLLAAAIALGYGLRAHREFAGQQRLITRLTQESARAQSRYRVQAERTQISRELHDTVGHALSVISLQANVAGEAVDSDPATATAAVDRVREQSRTALTELRTMVRALRESPGEGADETRIVASTANLDRLLGDVESAGLHVDAHIHTNAAELQGPVDAAAYRIVQEALTNALRHAAATRAEVVVERDGGVLHVRITDDGPATAAAARSAEDAVPTEDAVSTQAGSGTGLVGLGERVRLLGGTMTAGRAGERTGHSRIRGDDGGRGPAGFVVDARIPMGGRA